MGRNWSRQVASYYPRATSCGKIFIGFVSRRFTGQIGFGQTCCPWWILSRRIPAGSGLSISGASALSDDRFFVLSDGVFKPRPANSIRQRSDVLSFRFILFLF